MRNKIASVALAACLAITDASAQELTRVTPDFLRGASISLLREGNAEEAFQIAQLLLERDPKDVRALLVASQSSVALGDLSSAAGFARRAYWASSGGEDSFVAARIVANSLAAEGKDTRSQLWLRRARQYAPNEETSEAIAQDYQSLRRRNPWTTSLNFAITPSSNVNNGTINETAQVLGLPFVFNLSSDAQPLSGLQISGGFNTRYRLYANNTSALFFDIDAAGRTYALSAEAKDQAPDVKGSDFSDASLGIGLTYRTILSEGWQPTQAGVRFGQTWYAGDPYTSSIDLNFVQPVVLGDQDRLTFVLSSQARENEDDDPWVRTRRIRTAWGHSFENGDQLGLSFSLSEAQSQSIESDYEGFGVGASYSFATPFQGIAFSGALDFEQRSYDANIHQPLVDRVDDTLRLRLFARMTEIEFYGFQPVLTFDARRTTSNVTFYDGRDAYNFGFDLRSSF